MNLAFSDEGVGVSVNGNEFIFQFVSSFWQGAPDVINLRGFVRHNHETGEENIPLETFAAELVTTSPSSLLAVVVGTQFNQHTLYLTLPEHSCLHPENSHGCSE